MGTQALKSDASFSHDGFYRQTIQSDLLEGIVNIPKNLKHRMLEMILLPIESGTNSSPDKEPHLSHFAGAWVGEPLERGEQGVFEVREDLQ